MKKTQKLSSILNKNVVPPSESVIDDLKSKIGTDQLIANNKLHGMKSNVRNKYLIKRTCRKKYKLGKMKHRRTISVLIKGANLRKKVIQEKIRLSDTSIQDIKNYLKQQVQSY
jgi:hypothetical protein